MPTAPPMPPPLPKPKQKRSIHPGILIFVVAAALMMLAAVLFAIWRTSLDSGTKGRLKAIRAAGQPATARELDGWYAAVPAAENAALVWAEGFEKLNPKYDPNLSAPWSKIEIPKDAEVLSEEDLKLIEQSMIANADALKEFDRAAQMSRSRYPVDLAIGMFGELPHLGPLRASAKLLSLEAVHHAHANRTSDAIGSLLAVFAAARSLDQEPKQMSQYVRFAIDGIAQSTFRYLLQHNRFTDSDLALMQKQFEQAENPEPSVRGLIGERATLVTTINAPHEIAIPSNDPQVSDAIRQVQLGLNSPAVRASGFLQRDLRFYLDAMATNLAFARFPFPQKFLVVTNSQAMERLAVRKLTIFSTMYLAGLDRYIGREADHLARMHCARTATALERYRLAHGGNLPGSLTDLAPQFLGTIPLDPFDGAPLRYNSTNLTYNIYSIGPDQKDDGGLDASESKESPEPLDITFKVRASVSHPE